MQAQSSKRGIPKVSRQARLKAAFGSWGSSSRNTLAGATLIRHVKDMLSPLYSWEQQLGKNQGKKATAAAFPSLHKNSSKLISSV